MFQTVSDPRSLLAFWPGLLWKEAEEKDGGRERREERCVRTQPGNDGFYLVSVC